MQYSKVCSLVLFQLYTIMFYPGLPVQAVALTLLVTLIMFLIYRYRIIKVTNKLRGPELL